MSEFRNNTPRIMFISSKRLFYIINIYNLKYRSFERYFKL